MSCVRPYNKRDTRLLIAGMLPCLLLFVGYLIANNIEDK